MTYQQFKSTNRRKLRIMCERHVTYYLDNTIC